MLADRAIKVYQSVGNPVAKEEFVTTVFCPYDEQRLLVRLFKRGGVRKVVFKTAKGKVLTSVLNKKVVML